MLCINFISISAHFLKRSVENPEVLEMNQSSISLMKRILCPHVTMYHNATQTTTVYSAALLLSLSQEVYYYNLLQHNHRHSSLFFFIKLWKVLSIRVSISISVNNQ